MSLTERIKNIADKWFITEGALFSVYCVMPLRENNEMDCPVRTGSGFIEINPDVMDEMSDTELEQVLKSEMLRILLKHPFSRKPENCSNAVCAMASDCVISSCYKMPEAQLYEPLDFFLKDGESYEWYAYNIQKQGVPASGLDRAALWGEDVMAQINIDKIIDSINDWGTVPGKIKDLIVASTKPNIDYRRAFAGFRASVLSSKRKLTRMRPNRRMEFEQMGSLYELSSRLLVAVDVSGSVSEKALDHFYSLIKRFFKYGIEQIDVVQFDAELGAVKPMKEASRKFEVCGRGGTSFQPAINYANDHKYDGLVILTDGYAQVPTIPVGFHTPLLWVTDNESEYKHSKRWMESLPHSRACFLKL